MDFGVFVTAMAMAFSQAGWGGSGAQSSATATVHNGQVSASSSATANTSTTPLPWHTTHPTPAPTPPPANVPRDISFHSLEGGSVHHPHRETHVFHTYNDWSAFWHSISSEHIRPRPDFNQEMVIAVFAGTKRTGGYTIRITRIQEQHDRLVAYVTETSPGRSCYTTQAITYPYHAVRVAKNNKPVHFEYSQKVNDCPRADTYKNSSRPVKYRVDNYPCCPQDNYYYDYYDHQPMYWGW